MPYIRVTTKRQVTFPKAVLDRLGAKAGDLLEVSFKGEVIEVRPVRRNILDLMGSVQVDGPQDFKAAREAALGMIAEEVIREGRPD